MTEQPMRRRSTRLKGYDYADGGAYFITIVAVDREHLFGHVQEGRMVTNSLGDIINREWLSSGELRAEIELDEFILMPNQFHGIVFIRDDQPTMAVSPQPTRAHSRAHLRRAPRSVSTLIAGFKATTTRLVNEIRATPGVKLWQRNYHDRIIRNEREFHAIRQYIYDNPEAWEDDPENP